MMLKMPMSSWALAEVTHRFPVLCETRTVSLRGSRLVVLCTFMPLSDDKFEGDSRNRRPSMKPTRVSSVGTTHPATWRSMAKASVPDLSARRRCVQSLGSRLLDTTYPGGNAFTLIA